MADEYDSFSDLEKSEKNGVDFSISVRLPKSGVAIIAPHGGMIEFMTAEIADAIAGADARFYAFEGKKAHGNAKLHITSTNFDEPICVNLIKSSETVVAIHGLADGASDHEIDIGGRDAQTRDAICAALKNAGFKARVVTSGGHAAISGQNICNRGKLSAGVQLELTAALRKRLHDEVGSLATFSAAVRSCINNARQVRS